MTKKQIIQKLNEKGYKANYKNTLISTFEKGYVLVIQNKDFVKVFLSELQ